MLSRIWKNNILKSNCKSLMFFIRIYYCPLKKVSICFSCYQDFFIHEKVIRIEDLEMAKQTISKAEIWLKTMRQHGELYEVDKIHENYLTELKAYEEKFNKIKTKFEMPK